MRPHDSPEDGVVLIVEDDASTANALADFVTLAGYATVITSNGREALDYLASGARTVCLIVLDLMMPVMDGWELRRLLLADPRFATIPVVVVTADANASRRGQPAQAVGFLVKPVEPTALLETIGRYC